MRENRPYGSEGGEQRYCSPTPIGKKRRAMRADAWTPASPERRRCVSHFPRSVVRESEGETRGAVSGCRL